MTRKDYGPEVRAPRIQTDDGSYTFHHPGYGEPYHTLRGAESEAEAKFIRPTRLREKAKQGPIRLLDIGFGLGINCRAAMACASTHPLHIDSLESELEALDLALEITPSDPLLLGLKADRVYENVRLLHGDLRDTLRSLKGPYDIIFHDPFSPIKNTEAWTVEVFTYLKKLSAPHAMVATYSESAIVRGAMIEAGWHVGASSSTDQHRGGTVAVIDPCDLECPIDPETISTEPYRDPDLCWSGKEIRSKREAVVRSSRS